MMTLLYIPIIKPNIIYILYRHDSLHAYLYTSLNLVCSVNFNIVRILCKNNKKKFKKRDNFKILDVNMEMLNCF